MVKWLSCGGEDLIEADDIRWTDIAWKPRAKGKKIGEHDVEGKVEFCDREWVHVRVTSCETRADAGRTLDPYKSGELLRRRRHTLTRGKVHRMTWTDESARALVKSAHFKPEPRVVETPKHAVTASARSKYHNRTRRHKRAPRGARKMTLKP
jgi:hypothetical protein